MSTSVRGADECKDRFLSAPHFGRDAPLLIAGRAVENQDDVPVIATVLTHTGASKDDVA